MVHIARATAQHTVESASLPRTFNSNCFNFVNPVRVTGVCCDAAVMCQIDLSASTNLAIPNSGSVQYFASQESSTVTCQSGYAFYDAWAGTQAASIQIQCLPDVQTVYNAPNCAPTQCSSLAGIAVSNGQLSAYSGQTGDVIKVVCNVGLVPSSVFSYQCTGSPSVGGSDWSPSINSQSTIQCAQYSSATADENMRVTWASQYQYTVSWDAFNIATLPAGVDSAHLQYQLTITRAFPINAQLSAANAQESGLIASPSTFMFNTSQMSANITADSAGYVEGVNFEIQLQPVVLAVDGVTVGWSGTAFPLAVIGPCGCDIVNNYHGIPQNVQLSQSFDADNQLTLTFLPQSLCASRYTLASNATGKLVNLGLSVISTEYAANAQQCGSLTAYQTPIEEITWQLAGRTQTICVQPLPMQICEQCEPTYTQEFLNLACTSFTPQYWFVVSGQVTSAGNTASAAGVAGVEIVVSVNGQPFTASGMTDTRGRYQIMAKTPMLTAQSYNVTIQPYKTDSFTSSALTVLATQGPGNPALVALAPGAAFWYNDGSTTTVNNATYVSFTVTTQYVCDPSVFIFQSPIANVSVDQLSKLTVQSTTSPLLLAGLADWNSNSSNDPTNPDLIAWYAANCPGGNLGTYLATHLAAAHN